VFYCFLIPSTSRLVAYCSCSELLKRASIDFYRSFQLRLNDQEMCSWSAGLCLSSIEEVQAVDGYVVDSQLSVVDDEMCRGTLELGCCSSSLHHVSSMHVH